MKLPLGLVVLLCAVCTVLCSFVGWPPQRGPSRTYSLPSIGKYPASTVLYPKNHGLPDAYRNTRFSRSVDGEVAPEHEQFAEEPAYEEVYRPARSVDEADAEGLIFEHETEELSRHRRSPHQLISPINRRPHKLPRWGRPTIYRV